VHYYKRNLGDYAKKAGRLTMLQHGAYTLLLDSCYDREQFPTLEQAIEWTWASSEAEIEAVKFVLNRFFTPDSDGRYVQARIAEELDGYHKTATTNKRIAEERETKRKEKGTKRTRSVNESSRSVNEAPPNHKPLTTNQEPLTIKQVKNTDAPEGVSSAVWDSFVQQRKKSRAVITPSVVETIAKEAAKANWTLEEALAECAARGWRGFKADWVTAKEDPELEDYFNIP